MDEMNRNETLVDENGNPISATRMGKEPKSRKCFLCPQLREDGLCYAENEEDDCVSKITIEIEDELAAEIDDIIGNKVASREEENIKAPAKKKTFGIKKNEKNSHSSTNIISMNGRHAEDDDQAFVSYNRNKVDTSVVEQAEGDVNVNRSDDYDGVTEEISDIVADINENIKKGKKRDRESGIEKIDTKHTSKKKRVRTAEEDVIVLPSDEKDDDSKKKPVKKKKKSEIKLYTISSLKKEVAKNSDTFSVRGLLLSYLVSIGYVLLASVYFELEMPYLLVLLVVAIFFAPIIFVTNVKNRNENGKFEDIKNYMNQFSNGMLDKRQVLASLEDTYVTFEGTSIGNVIRKMIVTMSTAKEVDEAEAASLKYIEELYPNSQIKMLHDFAMRIEKTGGDFKDEMHLLSQRRERWDRRIAHSESVLQQTLVSSTIMYLVIMVITGFIARSMPELISIVHLPYVEIGEVVLTASLFFLFTKIQTKKIHGWTNDSVTMDDDEVIRGVELLDTPNASKIPMQSYISAVLMIAMGAGAFYLTKGNRLITALFGVLALLVLFSKKIIYAVTKSRVMKEIQYAVPTWLFDVCLLMQKSNISVAITESLQSAPLVLRKEIVRFLVKLRRNPAAVEPYLEFYDNYDLPSVRTTMRILLSINLGTAVDNKAQMAQLIEHNLNTLEELDQRRAEAHDASVVRFQYFPMLPLGIVLITYFIGIISQVFNSMSAYI